LLLYIARPFRLNEVEHKLPYIQLAPQQPLYQRNGKNRKSVLKNLATITPKIAWMLTLAGTGREDWENA
jgi:hypothetical protein